MAGSRVGVAKILSMILEAVMEGLAAISGRSWMIRDENRVCPKSDRGSCTIKGSSEVFWPTKSVRKGERQCSDRPK